jgi:hypothetical protein
MAAQIVSNTPVWVWALLLGLLWLGFYQTRERRVAAARVITLPVAMTGLSLFSIGLGFGLHVTTLLAWGVAAGLTAWVQFRSPMPPRTRYERESGTFLVPGSAIPLAWIVGIFAGKYAIGAMTAIRPDLAAEGAFAAGACLLYGAFSGIFVGRAARLLSLRQA